MDIPLSHERQMVIDEVKRFVEREVIPVAHQLEHDDVYPFDLIEKLKALGVFSATIPEAYGGLGLDFLTYSQVIEQLARGWMSLAGVVNKHIPVAFMRIYDPRQAPSNPRKALDNPQKTRAK